MTRLRYANYPNAATRLSPSAPVPVVQTGLICPPNNAAGSDIQIRLDGANLLPRYPHTAIWKVWFDAVIIGYVGECWHTQIITDTFPASGYEFGTHGFPCDGLFDSGTGQATGGTGGSGTVQYNEIAGLGASDFIATPGGSSILLNKDAGWLTRARTCELLGGGVLRHKFWPDITKPTELIQIDFDVALVPTSPTSPAFQWGASPWRSNHPAAGQNDETVGGKIRGLIAVAAAMTIEDITIEAAYEDNSFHTAVGVASGWYRNVSPTPTDVLDKSGRGHHAAYVGAQRPTLWTP